MATLLPEDLANTPAIGTYGLTLYDEVHHLPTQLVGLMMERIKTFWKVGLTATDIREDQKKIDNLVGSCIHDIGI